MSQTPPRDWESEGSDAHQSSPSASTPSTSPTPTSPRPETSESAADTPDTQQTQSASPAGSSAATSAPPVPDAGGASTDRPDRAGLGTGYGQQGSGYEQTPPHTASYPAADRAGYRQDSASRGYNDWTAFGAQQHSQTGPSGYRQYTGYQSSGYGSSTAVAEPPRKRGKVAAIGGVTVLALAAAFGAGYLGSQVGSPSTTAAVQDSSLTQSSPQNPVALTPSAPPASADVQAVAKKLLPSVVSIMSVTNEGEGEGSGVILSADGKILTNNHVVAGSEKITVQFSDGTTATAKLIGGDATDDLAVLQAEGVSNLTPAALGSSADLAVGQQVVAIGSPLGLTSTVTTGIVSALNRPVRTAAAEQQTPQQQNPFGQQNPYGQQDPNGQQQDPNSSNQAVQSDGTVLNAIQTDAAINPGNSGGPLVNMSGQVIGINSAIAGMPGQSSASQAGNIGVGFAIPIDQAKRIANEIIENGYANRAVLGATVSDNSADRTSPSTGAVIRGTTDGGAAQQAGLQEGDVVTKIGDIPIDSSDALIAAIRSQVPGGKVNITFDRNGSAQTVEVTLGTARSS
ncbi:S1C family serine protease [Nakamurella aerolata]|uniref:PDZ domain-containing protein n=1 Tax=Nakamurella aerolata TaxID=1656892 RepID=A0A849ABB3_9ACTN|nr:trypsin-like peptidase domain-containing protein [Nakamurella aerolata]NNG36431.1 PDZ domain-containing protein [Nakamurella aerolata]